MNRLNDATKMQIRAANPNFSTWVSANAGSGKTRVLTDRVIRLLLHGVDPQHILCLTYTKAAANEMQNRLFERLGSWAMLETDKLIHELELLGETDAKTEKKIRDARVLFARALEAPGRLKIQTIHSFCSSVLRRFPLEAGVSPQFSEMDERSSRLLRSEILDEMSVGEHQHLIDGIVPFFTGADFDTVVADVVRNKTKFFDGTTQEDIWGYFDLSPDVSETSILNSVFLGSEKGLLKSLTAALSNGSALDLKAEGVLSKINLEQLDLNALELLEGVFLTKSGANPFTAKIGRFPTKATQKTLVAKMPEIESLMQRVEDARAKRIGLHAAQKTLALHNFAHTFLALFSKKKQQRGWLDFDDLILLTGKLLKNRDVSQWVLFKLDGGLDHILVDEAQDTSPLQWRVIESLTQEFFSGISTDHDTRRTVFVVGDKKQSIYSFQGAEPEGFDTMQANYSTKLEQIDFPFQSVELQYSFRSSPPILNLVDTIFNRLGLQGFDDEIGHLAFHSKLPGRVDLWDVVEKPEHDEKTQWFDPVDKPSPNHESVILAKQVAENIKAMCDAGVVIPDGFSADGDINYRPVREGDFLILVQGRSLIFHEIINACKNQGLEIAGADRLKIGGELAVRDLISLLSFLATPEDDLSLAEALKSPLFGWSEQELYTLAHHRPAHSFLWATLRGKTDDHPETLETLNQLRGNADFLRPYELLERILTRFNGRKKLLARLGLEADDGIDALLDQAIAYESMDIPSLTGFLTWLQSDDVEIKRQYDSESNQIRVMTVHGAKGLESPIVILPDTMKKRSLVRDEIISTADDFIFWKTNKANSPQASMMAEAALKQKQEEERLRLLYVAITRAEKWLIVCGAGECGKDNESWYSIVKSGMEISNCDKTEIGLRIQSDNWVDGVAEKQSQTIAATTILPDWALCDVSPPASVQAALSPSGLGGAKALAGETDVDCDSLAYGTAVHLLLEILPDIEPEQWKSAAHDLLNSAEGIDFNDVYAEATGILNHDDFKFIFQGNSLAEVPVSATIPALNDARIHGAIDRLVIGDTSVLAIDYKTNTIVPAHPSETPEGVLRQLGAYYQALKQIYPDKHIETAVLWTKNKTLVKLDHGQVAAALRHTSLP